MKEKNTLYVALDGTFNPEIITSNLIFFDFNYKRPFFSRLKLKKLLKNFNVVIRADVNKLYKIKIDYVGVLPKGNLDQINRYRYKEWVDKWTSYHYNIIRRELMKQFKTKIFLKEFK